MSAADILVAQLAAQRQRKVDVEEGKTVTIDTPSQFCASRIVDQLRAGDGDGLSETIGGLFRDWDGFTEADILGAAVGGDGKAPADARLLKVLLSDRPEWLTKLSMAAIELATEAHKKTQATSGN